MSRFTKGLTLVQNSPRLNRSNLEDALTLIASASANSDLIIFPELSLNGYMLQDKLHEDAWTLDELTVLKEASLEIDIVIGAALKETNGFYNAAIYLSEGEIRHIHHKVHLPNYGMFEEARYFRPGNQIKSFETKYGRAAMLVCEDLWEVNLLEDLEDELPERTVPLDLELELPDFTALDRLLLLDDLLLVAFGALDLLDPLLRLTAERDEVEDREVVALGRLC